MMDPIGFGFEHFDGIGRWREVEAGQPIDATGEILGGTTKGTFDGVPELASLLVDSPEVERCMTLQWFRYAYGRADAKEDACTIDDLTRQFAGSGRRIQDLIVALTQSEAFLSAAPRRRMTMKRSTLSRRTFLRGAGGLASPCRCSTSCRAATPRPSAPCRSSSAAPAAPSASSCSGPRTAPS
ncbi:DUF1585 domain-containing protein [Nannocystis pusilla]|uniref:DUF1585 domain-containing protein n=1 Tax=Nannocystis pusilla TaxID=889268 RepID=UPI003B78E4BE